MRVGFDVVALQRAAANGHLQMKHSVQTIEKLGQVEAGAEALK